jgi:hypothetical protein
VVIFEVGATPDQLYEFIDVFGQRFLGLIDPGSSVYFSYRVPNPGAPYPQDYIIDQDGNIAYWSDEYDPQRIISIIDGLLETGIEEGEAPEPGVSLELSLAPNPASEMVTITAGGFPV